MTIYFEREIETTLINALSNMPVVVITGLRQAGKSTLLLNQSSLKGRSYISLDDFAHLEAAKSNPESILGSGEPISIDEAQRCPELLIAIKKAVDQKRTPGRFLLSGSANFDLLKGVSESLAGRAVYLTLHPFTRREIKKELSTKPFIIRFFESLRIPETRSAVQPIDPSEIILGGMPTVCLGRTEAPLFWFKGYEQTYLERDVRALSQVTDLIVFRHLLQLTALRTGQLLNLSELGRDSKLTSVITSRYLGLLEASFVVRRLFPYLGNRSSRMIKSPKIYITDSGLACYLTDVENLNSGHDEPLRGALMETYAAQNLSALIEAHWPRARLLFWSLQGRHEVDFVIEKGREIMAMEIKSSTRWDSRDLSGLKAFLKATPHCRAAVLAYNGREAVQLEDRLWALPLGLLLS